MIKSKQKPAIVRLWQSINRNWGVAVGFLMLLFLMPLALLVNNPNVQYTSSTSADSSKPIVKMIPSTGQGDKYTFLAEVSDKNINDVEFVDIWWGSDVPSVTKPTGHYATISLKNFGIESNNFDWRSQVYTRNASGLVTNVTTLLPDDNSKSDISKVYISPSTNIGEINLSTKTSTTVSSIVKYRKVVKKSDNTIQFYVQVEFKDGFTPKDINVYMQARRSALAGGASSGNGNEIWTKVGIWKAVSQELSPLANQPPKFTSIPSSKATTGVAYRYAITATDPDSDSITYSLFMSKKPAWLKLEGNVLSGTPGNSDVGPASIVVMARDTYGNYTTQSWTINVAVPPTDVNKPPIPTITINSPKETDKFSGTQNRITWSISSISGISGLRISYAVQGSSSFTTIFTAPTSTTEYVWNSSTLPDGTYIIKVEALDNDGKVVSAATSAPFTISNKPNTSTIQKPRIIGADPVGNVTSTRKPRLTATILPGSADINISTLKVELNGQDITKDIDLSGDSFGYEPKEELANGEYTVTVTVGGKDAKDPNTDYAKYTWGFNIDIPIASTNQGDQSSSKATINLPLFGKVDQWFGTILIALFVILLFGLLIFAIIMLIRILRGKDENETTQITKYYSETDTVTPAITTTTTTTETSTDPFSSDAQWYDNTTANQGVYYDPNQTTTQTTEYTNTTYQDPNQYTEYVDPTTQSYVAPETQTTTTTTQTEYVDNTIAANPADSGAYIYGTQADTFPTETQTATTTTNTYTTDNTSNTYSNGPFMTADEYVDTTNTPVQPTATTTTQSYTTTQNPVNYDTAYTSPTYSESTTTSSTTESIKKSTDDEPYDPFK